MTAWLVAIALTVGAVGWGGWRFYQDSLNYAAGGAMGAAMRAPSPELAQQPPPVTDRVVLRLDELDRLAAERGRAAVKAVLVEPLDVIIVRAMRTDELVRATYTPEDDRAKRKRARRARARAREERDRTDVQCVQLDSRRRSAMLKSKKPGK